MTKATRALVVSAVEERLKCAEKDLACCFTALAMLGYSTEADRTLECEREVRQIIREVDAQEAERKPA